MQGLFILGPRIGTAHNKTVGLQKLSVNGITRRSQLRQAEPGRSRKKNLFKVKQPFHISAGKNLLCRLKRNHAVPFQPHFTGPRFSDKPFYPVCRSLGLIRRRSAKIQDRLTRGGGPAFFHLDNCRPFGPVWQKSINKCRLTVSQKARDYV